MGRKMIKSIASSMLSPSLPSANGANLDELEDDGVELLQAEASLDYLCNLSPHRYGPLQNFPSRDILNDTFFFFSYLFFFFSILERDQINYQILMLWISNLFLYPPPPLDYITVSKLWLVAR